MLNYVLNLRWFPSAINRLFPSWNSLYHLVSTFIGILLTFSPMHFLGFNVMPRRIPDFPDSFHSWNFLSSIGSGITFLSFAIFSYYARIKVPGAWVVFTPVPTARKVDNGKALAVGRLWILYRFENDLRLHGQPSNASFNNRDRAEERIPLDCRSRKEWN